jgi:hypothetical protein
LWNICHMRRQEIKIRENVLVHWKDTSAEESVLCSVHSTHLAVATDVTYAILWSLILNLGFPRSTCFQVFSLERDRGRTIKGCKLYFVWGWVLDIRTLLARAYRIIHSSFWV